MLRTVISIFVGRDHNTVTSERGPFGNISLEYFNYLNPPPFLSLLVFFRLFSSKLLIAKF